MKLFRAVSEKELDERLAMLSPMAKKVYDAIQVGMYAEPGFSDVTAEDVIAQMGGEITARQFAGYMSRLTQLGLVWTDYAEVNGVATDFIHTVEHDAELRQDRNVEVEGSIEEQNAAGEQAHQSRSPMMEDVDDAAVARDARLTRFRAQMDVLVAEFISDTDEHLWTCEKYDAARDFAAWLTDVIETGDLHN